MREGASVPLKKGKSKDTIAANIREMRKAGYSQDRAVAAAMDKAGRSKKKRKKTIASGD